MTVPAKILKLVDRFDQNLDAYKQGNYNETQVRIEFIDPMFGALGWDVDNVKGYAEAYKDVVHEDAIRVGHAIKAPDYSFRIGGQRKFFLEAKKPSVDIKEDIHPVFQLRRYAWSAKLPLSILTDFEEFAVYDCRTRPTRTDKASNSRILCLNFKEYIERWDEIAGIFSREAILKGSFDKYVESKKVRGTAEVDNAFLQEIERWRELLARNIALRNPKLTQRETNFAVQRTIDRIIFLRICEDRGIERYGQLMALQNGTQVYPRLFELFRQADDRYNSGLFHFRMEKDRPGESIDSLTPNLIIDDKILKDILKHLYYPDSPYEFSVLPADILGQVYEQFLGKVIRLTTGHRAVVEDKPEVKKAGGVYYTPTYIVDYIVKQTVGNLLEGKKPGPRGAVSRLKILDPACGSGSFLLGAYQYLLDWHRDEYVEDGPEKWAKGRNPRLYQGRGGDWRLTTGEKKRILLNNICGVDIDPQAVEVTKLSLLLKVLEGENQETLSMQLSLFRERALPDLGNNIKCGNSLIGPDFYEGKQMSLLDEEEIYRINAFDWNAEFPEIMNPPQSPFKKGGSERSKQGDLNKGGFDVVIGNPPYVLGRETFDDEMKAYFSHKYNAFGGKYDLYIYFTEKGISLINNGGILGFILPNTVLTNENATKLRKIILEKTSLRIIKTFKTRVFKRAQVENAILIIQNEQNITDSAILIETNRTVKISQSSFRKSEKFYFNIYTDTSTENLIENIRRLSIPLGQFSDICIGIQLGGSSKTETKESYLSKTKEDECYKKVLDGREINRYQKQWNGIFVRYGDWLHRKRNQKYFINQKIVIRQIGEKPIASYDEDQFFTLNTIYNIINNGEYSLKYFLGIINSKLGGWFWIKKNYDFKSIFPKIKKSQIEAIPIRTIDFSNSVYKARHDQMVTLVDRMLNLHKQLASVKDPQTKTVLQRQIETTDMKIDQLVYELYGLTDKEIKIVEEGLTW